MNLITWKNILEKEKNKKYFKLIKNKINSDILNNITIYPKLKDIFNFMKYTKFNSIKVVILGQDPYCNKNQANGLSFSVPHKIVLPKTLINIYKEMKNDIKNTNFPQHGCLITWAKQGVLLLNTILTVEKNKPYSHKNIGWEIFTNEIIKKINLYKKKIIFILWGKNAKKKIKLINTKKHYILTSSHPSPRSAYISFFGSKHFTKTNYLLKKNKIDQIYWNSIYHDK